MSEELALVRNRYFDIAVDQHTLATQSRRNPWIYGAIDKIFFFIGYLGEVISTPVHVNMAGTASANTAAIVLELNVIIEANVEYRLSFHHRKLDRIQSGFFKVYFEFENIHEAVKLVKLA